MPRVIAAPVSLLLAVSLVAACGDDDTADPTTTTTGPSEPGPTATTGTVDDGEPGDPPEGSEDAPAPDAIEDLSDAAISLVLVADLQAPIAMGVLPGASELVVAERGGTVRLVSPSGEVADTPVVDISGDTSTDVERGLLGLAVHPDGDRIYLSFTDRSGNTRVDEWRLAGDRVDPDSRRTILTQDQPYANHNGGHIAFGPDEMLYLGLGDGGGGGDPLGAGQDPTTLLGSIVRIDPEPDDDRPYTIPSDNPFVDGGGAAEIWMTGLRNPWRFSWDRLTGDLWVADVGQNALEEITLLGADRGPAPGRGANLGWAIFEGDRAYDGGPEPENYAPPLHTYEHGPGCSITGGYVYRGEAIAGLRGAYVYSDYCDARIHAVLQRDGRVVDARPLDVSVPGGQVVSFGAGPAGELYVLSLVDGLYRIDPAP